MISPNDKDRFHFDIGMLLLSSFESLMDEKGEILFYILDQINHGIPLLRDEEQRLSIAKLNHEAASRMLQSYNYTSAYNLAKIAISLLQDDAWNTYYDLSLQYYFLLSKAAHSNRKIDEAKVTALNYYDCVPVHA
jgi:predicted ATPase